jgi:hypothetical protein
MPRRHDAAIAGKIDYNFAQLLFPNLPELEEGMVLCRERKQNFHSGTFLGTALARRLGHKT